MIYAVYGPLLIPLLVVPVIKWLVGRLHPAVASWLVLLSAVVLAACFTAALGLLVFAGLSVLNVFARIGHWSPELIGQLDGAHPMVGLIGGGLLVILGICAATVTVRRIIAFTVARRTTRHEPDDGDLMVIQDQRPLAHAVPGRPGRIVVSTGLLAMLTPTERRALLAHERAHLAHGHHLFVAVVDIAAAINPLLRPLAATIRFTTERWADEIAAAQVSDRSMVALALAKVALASKPGRKRNDVAMGATSGPVPRRVAALLTSAPIRCFWSVLFSLPGLCAAIICCLLIGSVMFSLDAISDLQRAVALAQYVPGSGQPPDQEWFF